MKLLLTVPAAALLTISPLTAQDQPKAEAAKPSADNTDSHMATAQRLIEVSQGAGGLAAGFEAMSPMIDQQAQQMQLDVAQTEELKTIYRDWFTHDLDQQGILDDMAALYVEHFTEAELKELIAFYNTPLGKKTLEKLPAITQQGAQIGMQEAQAKQHLLLERLQPFMESIQAQQLEQE